jgi:hypothetical protein
MIRKTYDVHTLVNVVEAYQAVSDAYSEPYAIAKTSQSRHRRRLRSTGLQQLLKSLLQMYVNV